MKPLRRVLALAALLALALMAGLGGCASKNASSGVAYSLNGPRLAIAGEFAQIGLSGEMDRTCMVGIGKIEIESTVPDFPFYCAGSLSVPPTEKGRIRGILDCSEGMVMLFTLRNLGPDQGVGIARPVEDTGTMIFFYHASAEEARRRLPEVLNDMAAVTGAPANTRSTSDMD